MGLCFGLKHPQHFLQIKVLTRGVSLLKEVFPEKKKKCLFGIASQWNTEIQRRVI